MFSSLGYKISSEQFDTRLLNINFKRIDDYINSNTSIRFSCNSCSKIFRRKPKSLNKLRCKCRDNDLLYKSRIQSKNIVNLELYTNIRTYILHMCLSCDLEFTTKPKNIINSVIGCPSCSGKMFSRSKNC